MQILIFLFLKQITFSRKIETTCRIRKVIIYEDELDGIETDVVSNLDNLPFPEKSSPENQKSALILEKKGPKCVQLWFNFLFEMWF